MNSTPLEKVHPQRAAEDAGLESLGGWAETMGSLRHQLSNVQASDSDEPILLEALASKRARGQHRFLRTAAAIAATLIVTVGLWITTNDRVRHEGESLANSAGPNEDAVSVVAPTAETAILQFQALPGVPPDVGGAGGTLVRMPLPVWSVHPVSNQAVPVWMEAEVLVGADGIARAIRIDPHAIPFNRGGPQPVPAVLRSEGVF